MTIVAAMLAQDGVVIGADSEETVGNIKRSVDKLPIRTNTRFSSIVIGGAGPPHNVDTITQMLWALFEDADAANFPEAEFRKIISAYYKEHVLRWPSTIEREENDFSLVITTSLKSTEGYLHRLWIAQKGTFREALNKYAAVGSGADYGEILLSEYAGMHCTKLTVLLLINILRKVKQQSEGCGKETQMWEIKDRGAIPVYPPFVEEAEALLRKYDYMAMQQFFNIVNPDRGTHDVIVDINLDANLRKLRDGFAALADRLDRT